MSQTAQAIQTQAMQTQTQPEQAQPWCMNQREPVSFHPIMQQIQQTQLFTEAPSLPLTNLKRRTCDVSWNDGVEVSYEKRTKLK